MHMPTRFLNPNAPVLARIGQMETRLARTEVEVKRAMQLRFSVFHEDKGSAVQDGSNQLDADGYDAFCDHLLVLDGDEIVGTYRLLLQDRALQGADAPGFYSAAEFDLERLVQAGRSETLLELGRSCIAKPYRNKRTMELLWAGTWAYAVQNKIDIMFGCASFAGTDTAKHAPTLFWLGKEACLPAEQDCLTTQNSGFNLHQAGAEQGISHNPRRALAGVPPLLKGYLRLGAKVASQAFIDENFGTIDVLVVLKVKDINPRYLAHYGSDASRFAA